MSQLEHLLQQCTVKLTLPGRSGWGTGFFVAPGWILTCAHVVKEAKGEPIQVRWQNQENWAQAVVERSLADPYDLALLQVTLPANANPPCVYLDEEIRSRDPLYLFGYPDQDFPNGCPVTFNCEGLTGDEPALIKFALGQVRPGMSGSPLLNQRTGKVCGIVKFTRDRSSASVGGAIPTHVILEQFPQLRELQQEFHGGDRRWGELVTAPSGIDFQPYLKAIVHDYEQWWELYRLTETIAAQQATFTFEQTVQTEEPSKENPTQKETIPWPLLQGIIHYAKSEHVLLVGSPGVGKSTTLLRLLVVLAKQELQNPEPRIPVLVRLKDYQQSTSGAEDNSGILFLIKEALEPGLSLEISEIKKLLFQEKRLFLLFDGLNEIPADIVRSELTKFRAKCDRAKIPLVCTTRNLGDNLGITRQLDLQTLKPSEIQRFLRECMPGQEEQVLKLLNKGSQELGKTPFILWMLYDVYKKSDQIPESLGEAFSRFTKGYTNYKIDQEGIPVSPEDLQYWNLLLEYLAFEMLQSPDPKDPGLIISEKAAAITLTQFPRTNTIDRSQAQVLFNNLLKYHLLQKSHKDEVSFCHQLIQEYYAARYLWQLLPGLTNEQLKRDYLNYLKWTEAIALMLALPEMANDQATRTVDLALDVDLLLGARLSGEVQPSLQAKTVGWIKELTIPELLKVELLSSTKSVEAMPSLLRTIQNTDFSVRWSAATALGKIGGQESVQALLEASEDRADFVRLASIAALGSIGDKAAIEALLIVLENALDDDSCLGAAYELAKLNNGMGIQKLKRALNHSQPYVIRKAVSTLQLLNNEASNSVLLEALHHPRNNVRKLVVKALGEIGNDAWIPNLLKALEHEDSRSHEIISLDENVIDALGKIGNEKAIAALLSIAEHQNFLVQRKVLELFGTLSCKTAVPILQKALKDKNVTIREIAATSLGQIGDELAVSELLQALEDDPHVRVNAARALGQLDSKDAIPKLLKLLTDEDHHTRQAASDALGKIDGEEAIAELLNLLNHPILQIRSIAAKTLGLIGDKVAISGLMRALEKEDRFIVSKTLGLKCNGIDIPENTEEIEESKGVVVNLAVALVRLNCCLGTLVLIQELETLTPYELWGGYFHFELAGDLGIEAAIPLLFKTLEHQDIQIRSAAASALNLILRRSKKLSETLIPLMRKTLKNAHEFTCDIAISILGKINDNEAVSAMLELLNHPSVHVQRRAASALAKLGNESVIPMLLEDLKNEDQFVRIDAASALGDLGSASVVSAFVDLLNRGSSKAKKEVIKASEKIGSPKVLTTLQRLELELPDYEISEAIAAIQNRCQFYNYEIAQGLVPPGKPIALFFSYAPNDEDLRDELEKHLSILKREGVITSWDNRQILPGDEREQVISDRLNTADIILLLISPDSMSDDTCYDIEIRRAMERHQAGEALVIPILLRPVDWTGALFSQLTVLPKNRQPVTKWDNRDEAFQAIAEGIREGAIALRKPER